MAHGTRGAAGQTTTAPPNNVHASNGVLTDNGTTGPAKVNQKKAKRRAKEAAKKLAQSQPAGAVTQAHVQNNPQDIFSALVSDLELVQQHPGEPLQYDDGYDDQDLYDGEQYYSDDDPAYHQHYDPAYPTGSHPGMPAVNGTGSKNKKKKGRQESYGLPHNHHYHTAARATPPPPPGSLAARLRHHRGGEDHIWNTSTQQERERIKEFWLSLKEEERRSLVKVEKEAVLKKMKEQQKHSCSCTVCGRKRTAIEEELEVLYDAYYEELEQYDNKEIPWATLLGIPASLSLRHNDQRHNRLPPDRMPPLIHSPPPRGHIVELSDDEEENLDEEEEYSDDEEYDDEDYSEDEPEEIPRASADFFNFGNSLTVKGSFEFLKDCFWRR
jgi:hypothetical protein